MKKILALFTALCLVSLSGCENTGNIVSSESGFSDSEISDSTDSENTGNSDSSGNPGDLDISDSNNENNVPEYLDFFGENKVHTLNVEMAASAWNEICAAPGKKEYKHADITIDGKTVSDCGFKTHGNSTLNTAVEYGMKRFPFKIKFDKYTDDTFLGLDELVLCNNIIDLSYSRQFAGYEAFRAIGADAPMCAYFNVYINGELFGLYAGVEDIDDSYLERVFDSSKHNLYKMDEMATLTPNMDFWMVSQKKGTNTSRTDLKLLIKTLDEMPLGEKGKIEDILDVQSALAYIAVGAVIHHCDGYGGEAAHNYCLYMDDGVFHVIPWDMDLCYYQTGYGFAPSAGSKMDIKNGLTGDVNPAERPLIYKLLAVEEYYKLYLDYCSQLTEWLKHYSESGIAQHFALIDESVKNDPRNIYGSFKGEYNPDYHYGFAGYIKERVEYLEKRIPEIYKEKGVAE